MYKLLTILMIAMMIICAIADIIEEFWPNHAIKAVKPIILIATLAVFPMIMEFLMMMIDVEAMSSFLGLNNPGGSGFLDFILELFF